MYIHTCTYLTPVELNDESSDRECVDFLQGYTVCVRGRAPKIHASVGRLHLTQDKEGRRWHK